MLRRIVWEIEKNHGAILLKDLARKLEVDPFVLEGMLQTMSRIKQAAPLPVEITCSRGACSACPLHTSYNDPSCSGYRVVSILPPAKSK